MITSKRYFDKQFINVSENHYIEKIINNRKHFFSSSGRGGLEAIIKMLNLNKAQTVLLPALSPQGVVLPFQKKEINIKFYKINKDLTPDINHINNLLEKYKTKIILIIHYYGFIQPIREIRNKLITSNIILIEDCAQALYKYSSENSIKQGEGDILFFSFPKFLPVPDGSLFIFNNNSLFKKGIKYKYSFLNKVALINHRLYLKLKRYQIKFPKCFHAFGISILLKGLYFIYYKALCVKRNPNQISNYSYKLIKHFNFYSAIKRRKENISLLNNYMTQVKQKRLNRNYKTAVFTGYPIIVKNQQEFKKYLKKQDIESIVYNKYWFYHGDQNGDLFKNEKYIRNHIILLPVNESNSINKMKTLTNKLNHYNKL